ncbi:MAG TPA: class I SAM-dependent methyltransferase [Candidatus Binatia bacterium]|nr:class I SAM-dependent methyltransferase [Candidatus Binatia bacterium]
MTADGDDANGGERGLRTRPTGPTLGALLRDRLEAALAAAEAAAGDRPIVALDAGCGERTSLRSVRHRIGRLIGVDLHPPSGPGPDVDEFLVADLCTDPLPLAEGSVDLAVSTFTLEHFADPGAALRTIARCLAPGGRLVVVTVNRRHPFVAAYLALPSSLRNRLQALVKARSADAHPLVGGCNDPLAVRDALSEAGFAVETLDTVGHLATAWGLRWWSRILGRLGDRLAAPFPSRRSTIVAVARAVARTADPLGTPEAEGAALR